MGRKGDQRLRQFVDHLVATGVRELGALDIDEPTARQVMTDVAHQVCSQFGRSSMYVPALLERQLTARDERIWEQYGQDSATARRFTEDRLAELAAEHRLTLRHLYNIVQLMRRREQALRQPMLDGMEERS